jgi:hypothetical protein
MEMAQTELYESFKFKSSRFIFGLKPLMLLDTE